MRASSCGPSGFDSLRLLRVSVPLSMLLIFVSGLHAATTFFAASDQGPAKSTDGGLTWSVIAVNVNSGLLSGEPIFYNLAIDPKTPSIWYGNGRTANGTYGFYKSTDSGQTWTGTPFVNFQTRLVAGSL